MPALWYLPIGVTHGNATLIAERTAFVQGKFIDVWLPSAWAGFFLDIFVLLFFFIFKRQRKFLFVLAGLTTLYQFFHFLREVTVGSPIPAVNEFWFWTDNKYVCITRYVWLTWVESSEYVISTTIAIVISAALVKGQSPSQISSHFKAKFVKWLIIYPLAYAAFIFVILIPADFVKVIGSCAALDPIPSILAINEFAIVLAITSFILGTGVRAVYTMYRNGTSFHRVHFLYLAFLAIIILQWTPRLGYNFWEFATAFSVPAGNLQNALWWYSTLSILPSYLINSVIVFALGFVGHHHASESESESDQKSASKLESGNDNDTEMLLRNYF